MKMFRSLMLGMVFLFVFPALVSAEALVLGGKYSNLILEAQNEDPSQYLAHDDCGCDACMVTFWTGVPNNLFFSSGEHCNGMGFPFALPGETTGWEFKHWWLIYGDEEFENDMMNPCGQNMIHSFEDPRPDSGIYCTYQDADGYWDIRGAYINGPATGLDTAKGLIQRHKSADLSLKADKDVWDEMCMTHEMMSGDSDYEALSEWGKRFVVSMKLWTDSTDVPIVKSSADARSKIVSNRDKVEIPPAETTDLGDVFWIAVWIHSFTCWMSPQYPGNQNGVYGFGLELMEMDGLDWAFSYAETPDFVFEIAANTGCIGPAPVDNESTSWGSIKARYR